MQYVALLRGINVGGNNKVSMAELKLAFQQADMTDVITYINSGNVIFGSTETNRAVIADKLEAAVINRFGFAVKILVWDAASFLALASQLPPDWSNDAKMKCDVLFLWESIDQESIVDQLTIKPGIDRVIYQPGALLWSVDKANVSRSGLLKLVGTDIYKQMTIRNCNTLRKLAALLT